MPTISLLSRGDVASSIKLSYKESAYEIPPVFRATHRHPAPPIHGNKSTPNLPLPSDLGQRETLAAPSQRLLARPQRHQHPGIHRRRIQREPCQQRDVSDRIPRRASGGVVRWWGEEEEGVEVRDEG